MSSFSNLDINDFMRTYDDRHVDVKEPDADEENDIFNSMLKNTEESKIYVDYVGVVDIRAAGKWQRLFIMV